MTARAKSLIKRAKDASRKKPGKPIPIRSTDAGNVIRVFLDGLERLGYNPESLLEGTGVRRSDLVENPDVRFSCTLTGTILSRAMQTCLIKNLGMKLAAETPMGAFPLLDYLVLSCANVSEAVHQLSRYFRLVDAPCVLEVQDHGNFTRVCYHGRNVAFSFEFGITLALMHLHRETENRFMADHVAFTHQPDDIHEMEQVLNCQVRTNSSWNGFAFTRESGRLPLRRGDAILHHVLERQAAEIAARLPKQDGVVSEVRRVLAARLSQGEIQIEKVARELATSVRSLQRRLAEAKISFQQLVDDTRREAADTYLNNQTLSIGEVAYLLGYSEPAAFHRAFKRWQGITPQASREQAAHH